MRRAAELPVKLTVSRTTALTAAVALALVSGCAPLPGVTQQHAGAPVGAASPAATATAPAQETPVSALPGAPSTSAPPKVRASALFTGAGAADWPTATQGLTFHANSPQGVPPELVNGLAPVLQRFALAGVAGDGIISQRDPERATYRFLESYPDQITSWVQDSYLDGTSELTPGAVQAASFTRLAPGVLLLDEPRVHVTSAVVPETTGRDAGSTRLAMAVTALYPVAYQGKDYLMPLRRTFSVNATLTEGAIDQWAAHTIIATPADGAPPGQPACDATSPGTVHPDTDWDGHDVAAQVASLVADEATAATPETSDPDTSAVGSGKTDYEDGQDQPRWACGDGTGHDDDLLRRHGR